MKLDPRSMTDCTICAVETSRGGGWGARRGVAAPVLRGKCLRAIRGAPDPPALGIFPLRTRRPRWSVEDRLSLAASVSVRMASSLSWSAPLIPISR